VQITRVSDASPKLKYATHLHFEDGMSDHHKTIEAILREQLQLLTLSLYTATKGPTIFLGETLACELSDAKTRTSQMIAMGAGQSVSSLLKCADWRGMAVRDLYPIARSAVESFINAAFLLSESEKVAERAVRWVRYRSWKQVNRTVGRGEFSLTLSSGSDTSVPLEFTEFTAKGLSREWSTVDTPERIRVVGKVAGKKAGSRMLASYALIYAVSSEVIHGSPFGINYFYQTHLDGASEDHFLQGTGRQLDDILTAVSHAIAGYLSTFFALQKMNAPYRTEQEIFNRLLVLEGVDPQPVMNIEDQSL
jgi:hypothetical protein